MTQNNLYMENDELRLYVDVQPLTFDALENSKNEAAASAENARQSAENASNALSSMIDYKNRLEIFYAQASDNLSSLLNNAIESIINTKNTVLNTIQTLGETVLSNINNTFNEVKNSIQTLGQSYVNQAKNYADEAKDIADNIVSLEHINQYKALETGDISSDNNVLPWIRKMAYSTFDRSKFTVAGSPTITDDGIASGFSSGNYLNLPDFDVTGKSFEFDLGKVYVPASTGASHALFNVLVDPKNVSSVLNFAVGSAGEMYVSGANKNAAVKYLTGYSLNNYYWVKIGSDNSTIVYCKISTDGVNYTTITTPLLSPYTTISHHGIGRASTPTSYWLGDYDLRQFKLSVDGVEVFSGNRTGIDTIKPDNYTVVGTPTISADGILDKSVYETQEAALGNYLSHYIGDIPTTSTIRVKCKFTVKQLQGALSTAGGGVYGLRNESSSRAISIPLLDSNSTTLSVYGGASSVVGFYTLNIGTTYYLETIDTFTQKTVNIYDANDNLLKTGTYDKTIQDSESWENVTFYISQSSATQQGNNSCSFDLNEFKVWIDGNLVYQPCLKIPYTYAGNGKGYNASTGSKIVQSIYRDRISDMYEQFGYAPYYTLSDTDFTLPQGELYGMIENLRKLVIERTSQVQGD